ncbi:MAG: 4a-hydroxytetrahydrobiopterin dehydratase [Acidobacteriota bacterium]
MRPTPKTPPTPAAHPLTPTGYYQLVWESGLAALPGPGDLPSYLKPERIQKSLTAGLPKLVAFAAEKADLPGDSLKPERIQKNATATRPQPADSSDEPEASTAPEEAAVLDVEAVMEHLDSLPDWHLANYNRSLVKGFVRQDSGAANEFAAFAAGVCQAAGLAPAFAVALNTVWVVLTDPLAGGITEAAVAVAERLELAAGEDFR